MYQPLGHITLKSGERVELGVVQGPDEEWADRILALLSHKGDIWNWQNAQMLKTTTGLDAFYYLLHRKGQPFANVMTIEVQGCGLFGHVWTVPEHRRQAAMSQLVARQMAHFQERGGKALFLGTGYDSPAYHIYRSNGFRSVEEKSGYMSYYARSRETFEEEFFSPGPARIESTGWLHWPASAPLFIGDFPGTVRSVPLGLLGRRLTEGPLLPLLRDQIRRQAEGLPSRSSVSCVRDAVVGLACWDQDPVWPSTCVLDVYCHPQFWNQGPELLKSLVFPEAERIVAYSDAGCPDKETVLEEVGFREIAFLPKWAAVDRSRTVLTDVRMWERIPSPLRGGG